MVEEYVRAFCASATFEGMVVESTRRQLERHRAAGHVSENDELCIQNEELCVKKEEVCIKNNQPCS